MKALSLLLLPLLLCACGESGPSSTTVPAHDPATRKQAIDALAEMGPQRMTHYARMDSVGPWVIVTQDDAPEGTLTFCFVMRDANGRLLSVSEAPQSISGDWYITLTHYFDEQGRTFAFERRASYYNSICAPDLAHETTTRYYAPDGRELEALFNLKDDTGKELDRAECQFPYDYPYTMYPNSAELAKGTGLPLDR